jgi:NADPH2:quinone reductase
MVIDGFGGPEKLHWAKVPTPVARRHEVLIKLAATSVNPVDWKICEGRLKDRFPHRFPLIPGWDAAGTVAAMGQAVQGLKIGDAVYAYCRKPEVQWGTYAEFVTVDADAAAPAPARLPPEQTATLPLVGLTAWQALFNAAGLKSGQTVLIHAGAGGVGGMAIQLAKAVGARVLTTARAENHDYVRSLGADLAIDYSAAPFGPAVRKAAPAGVEVVFDTVGGQTQADSWAALAKGGILVSIAEPPDEKCAQAQEARGAYVFVSPNGRQLRELALMVASGRLRPPLIDILPLDAAAQALERSRAGHVRGKIVLKIG